MSPRDLLPDVGPGYYAVRDGVHNFGDQIVYVAWEWMTLRNAIDPCMLSTTPHPEAMVSESPSLTTKSRGT